MSVSRHLELLLLTHLLCNSSVKIGILGRHSSAQLLQNLSTSLPHVVKNIRENWDNVQSIHIKTSSSASLPIWSCQLDEEEGGRWDGLTRVLIPDDAEGEVKQGKRRALESEDEPERKRKKSDASRAKDSTSTSRASRPDPPPTESTPSKERKLTEAKQKPARVTATDFLDLDSFEDQPSASKPSVSNTAIPSKTAKSKPLRGSKDSAPTKSRSPGAKPSETKTILKSSKKVAQSGGADMPAKEKHVKFAVKLPDPKTKRNKALGVMGKKVRSGGGRSASVKDGVLGKRLAVK